MYSLSTIQEEIKDIEVRLYECESHSELSELEKIRASIELNKLKILYNNGIK